MAGFLESYRRAVENYNSYLNEQYGEYRAVVLRRQTAARASGYLGLLQTQYENSQSQETVVV